MRRLRFVGRSSIAGPALGNVAVYGARPVSGARKKRAIRLWLPLTPLFLILSPLVMVASPLASLTRAGRRLHPVQAAWALGGVLLGLTGTRISVDTPAVQIRIHIL